MTHSYPSVVLKLQNKYCLQVLVFTGYEFIVNADE